jgi:hypothetical protein
LKARGIGSVVVHPVDVSNPVSESIEKQAMLLWPRFGAYKNLPDDAIWI